MDSEEVRRVVHFELSELDPERDSDGHGYVDLLASDLLSVGYAVWPAGGEDRQRPHEEDEVYHVVAGRGSIRVAGEDTTVGPGSIVYVAARVEHRFHSIVEELRVLVFWAPPHVRA
jgi:mannose-6-phosphate isomerase-like protein (cupin superfamily)